MVALSSPRDPFFVGRVPRVISVSSEGPSLRIFIGFRKFLPLAQEAESPGAQPLRSRLRQAHVDHVRPTQCPLSIKDWWSGRGGEGHPPECQLPRKPAKEAAAMETTAVTCVHHSRLQREILRIYLRTNKIMMVLLTLPAPNPRLLHIFPSPHHSPPCLSSIPFLIIPSFPSSLHQYFSFLALF